MTYCSNSECDRETRRGRTYCERCAKRVQRGGRAALKAPLEDGKTPLERVIDAGSDYLEAGDDHAEEEALKRAFLRAIEGWMRSRGWQPPGSITRIRKQEPRAPQAARRRTIVVPTPTRLQLQLPLEV